MSESHYEFKVGDLVECEYIKDSFVNGRIDSVNKAKSIAEVIIGITSRKTGKVSEERIEVSLNTLTPWNPKGK
ncbi:hypothetical protein [Bacillus sp. NPDC094106]|uniref:hypothetical protein n=1 Tax=Bacillus sp. NPDC094106 TaxID=3363949 RepID=UPI0037FB4481